MMQLTSCASPAILGVTANISQDGSSVQALTPQGIRQGLCPPPGTGQAPTLAVQMASGALGQKRGEGGRGEVLSFYFLLMVDPFRNPTAFSVIQKPAIRAEK